MDSEAARPQCQWPCCTVAVAAWTAVGPHAGQSGPGRRRQAPRPDTAGRGTGSPADGALGLKVHAGLVPPTLTIFLRPEISRAFTLNSGRARAHPFSSKPNCDRPCLTLCGDRRRACNLLHFQLLAPLLESVTPCNAVEHDRSSAETLHRRSHGRLLATTTSWAAGNPEPRMPA